MPRRKRFLHPDQPMTRLSWLVATVILAEAAIFLWLAGAMPNLSCTACGWP